MKKKITVFALLVAMCTCMFVSFGVNASSAYYGTVLSGADTLTLDYKDYKEGKIVKDSKMDLTLVSGGSCYVIGFLGDCTSSDGRFSRLALVYSTSSFVVTEHIYGTTYFYDSDGVLSSENSFDHVSNNRSSKKDSNTGLYYYLVGNTASYSFDIYSNDGNGCPMYRKDCIPNNGDVENFLSQLSDGTFEQSNEDDYVDGSECPEFDPDTAEYVKDIGYLQNIVKKMAIAEGGSDGVAANFTEVKYTVSWSAKTNTDFDVTQENVYVAFYNQVLGYKQNLPAGKKQEVVGSKVLIDKVKGSDLAMTFYQTDINSKCAEDLAKLDYTPILQTISRSDAEWFRIEVYNPDTGTYTYGGWVKLAEKGDGDESTTTTTWEPDTDGGNDDVQDSDGGYDDGERTPTEVGEGDTIEDAEDKMRPVDTTAEFPFTDFVSILDALTDSIGKFPQLVAKVFSFLPSQFIGILVAGLAVVVICRVLGR